MKILTALFSLLICPGIYCQGLNNTEWIQIKVERKDGSRIINNRSGNESLKYYFIGDSVLRSGNEEYSFRQKYFSENNILLIGNATKFKIDSLSDIILIITDVSDKDVSNDKLNTRTFINADYIFDYLRQTHQLKLVGDSIILADKYFSPTYNGDFGKYFMSKFDLNVTNEIVSCAFMISTDGTIEDIQLSADHKIPKYEINKISRIIKSTQGFWIIPPVADTFKIKLDFSAILTSDGKGNGFYLFTFHPESSKVKGLTTQQRTDADNYFDTGINLFKKEKFDKAIIEFQKCIK